MPFLSNTNTVPEDVPFLCACGNMRAFMCSLHHFLFFFFKFFLRLSYSAETAAEESFAFSCASHTVTTSLEVAVDSGVALFLPNNPPSCPP